MYERVSKAVCDSMKQGFSLVVLSGDHSISGDKIAGIKIAKPKCKSGIIWKDAHADIHTPYTTPSGNMHGMPLSIYIHEDNEDFKVR